MSCPTEGTFAPGEDSVMPISWRWQSTLSLKRGIVCQGGTAIHGCLADGAEKRWDNVEHFPGLPHFPHHVHMGEEAHVEPGRPLSILALLDMLEQELRSSDLTEGGSL